MTITDAQAWGFIIVSLGGAMASIIAAINAKSAKYDTKIMKHQQIAMTQQVDTIEVNTNNRVTRQDTLITGLMNQVSDLTAHVLVQNNHIEELTGKLTNAPESNITAQVRIIDPDKPVLKTEPVLRTKPKK